MAKLKTGLSTETIKALAQTIDFYYWKGIPVIRKWPDWTGIKSSPTQKEWQQVLAQSRADQKEITEELKNIYREQTIGKKRAYIDELTSQYLKKYKETRTYPPVLTDITSEETATEKIITAEFINLDDPPNLAIIITTGTEQKTLTEKKGRLFKCPLPPEPITILKKEEKYLDWTGLIINIEEMTVSVTNAETQGNAIAVITRTDGDWQKAQDEAWATMWNNYPSGTSTTGIARIENVCGRGYLPWIITATARAWSGGKNIDLVAWKSTHGSTPPNGIKIKLQITNMRMTETINFNIQNIKEITASETEEKEITIPFQKSWYENDTLTIFYEPVYQSKFYVPVDNTWRAFQVEMKECKLTLTPSKAEVEYIIPKEEIPKEETFIHPFYYFYWVPFTSSNAPVHLPIKTKFL